MADDLHPADDLVWPPPDEELDALTPLPLPPAVPAAPPRPDAVADVTITVDAPPVVPVGAADFAARHVAGDVVLHSPPPESRVGAGTATVAFLVFSLFLGYTVAAQFWP